MRDDSGPIRQGSGVRFVELNADDEARAKHISNILFLVDVHFLRWMDIPSSNETSYSNISVTFCDRPT